MQGFAAVAQLDRVLGYEPRGRGFDSCQPHHNLTVIEKQLRDQKSLSCFSLCMVLCSIENWLLVWFQVLELLEVWHP